MKTAFLKTLIAASCFVSVMASAHQMRHEDIRSNKDFVATCPEKYLTYIDRGEGGPGPYCACPQHSITYIDKAEGGPGFICIDKENN